MRHRVGGRKFNRPTGHRILMYRNLVTDLLRHEKIQTTETKAKEIRPMAEKIITLGKEDSLHNRRQAAAYLMDPLIVRKLFEVIGKRFNERPSGYTRIVKTYRRHGDAASMAVIELVD